MPLLAAVVIVIGALTTAGISAASAGTLTATPVLQGSQWFTANGGGVNVCFDSGTTNGVSNGTISTCGGQAAIGTNASYGYWQCVEMAQRFYQAQGWWSGVFPSVSVAADIYNVSAAKMHMTPTPNGSITSIVPGDMIVHGSTDKYSPGAGHVAIVDHVSGSTVYAVQQNAPQSTTTYSLSNGSLSGGSGTDILGIVHSPNNHYTNNGGAVPPPPGSGNSTNGTQVSLAGRFVSGDTGQDFIYITKNTDDGWTASAWKSTANSGSNQLTWAGNYFTQPGGGVNFDNTVFFTGDANGDGLTDLYYASALNWDTPGFTVGILYNTGNGFTYGGTVWTSTNLELSQVKFLPGDWTGSGKQGFAYVNPNSSGGFDVSVFGVNSSNQFYSAGVWFSQGGPNVSYYNTKFIPLDANGDGRWTSTTRVASSRALMVHSLLGISKTRVAPCNGSNPCGRRVTSRWTQRSSSPATGLDPEMKGSCT
jgi:hypothetical protein